MDDDGFVFVTGRIKELIIKGGENIAPREVDEVLLEHEAVLEAAAFAVPCDQFGQRVESCVAFQPGRSATEANFLRIALRNWGNSRPRTACIFWMSCRRGRPAKYSVCSCSVWFMVLTHSASPN